MNNGPSPARAAAAALLLCVLAGPLLSGCSKNVPAPVPPARESALSWNRRGLAAEARGNHDGAISAFDESLRINRSIEDFGGISVALINLARVHRRKAELSPARERIGEALRLVPPGDPLFPEAAFEMAMVELDAGNLPAAQEWARKAVPAEKNRSSGRMRNLLARVLFLQGKAAEARPLAEAALESSREHGVRAEEGNSLRLLGDIALAGGDRQGAETRYREALAIDKDMAESRKIAADLRGLGAASAMRGDTESAIGFYRRAAEVSRSGGEPKEADAALEEIERIGGDASPWDGTKPAP